MNFSDIESSAFSSAFIMKPTIQPKKTFIHALNFSLEEMANLRDQIQNFEKIHQIEILRILYTNGAVINFNKNGSLINMLELDSLIINKIASYVDYVKRQEQALSQNEIEKESIKNKFFSDSKDQSTPDITNLDLFA